MRVIDVGFGIGRQLFLLRTASDSGSAGLGA